MKIAFQMDPIGPINIDGDSSFRLAEEAQARGHELFYYTPDNLAYDEGRVTARGWPLTVQRVQGDHFALGEQATVDLSDFDVVWLRQDPPFDMFYITTTHILDRLAPGTLVVNDPFWVRNYPEKLLVLDFPDLMPPTTIARDLANHPRFHGPSRRYHPQTALRQWRRRGVPPAAIGSQPRLPARNVHRLLARAADRAEIPARDRTKATNA